MTGATAARYSCTTVDPYTGATRPPLTATLSRAAVGALLAEAYDGSPWHGPSLATALNPIIGYAAAAEIAKESARTGQRIPDLLRERKLISEEQIRSIFTPEFLAGQADRK